VLTNHRTDRMERIIGCLLVLKKKHRVLWSKTVSQVEVKQEDRRGREPRLTALLDIELEPMSAPKVITVRADGSITEPIESLPDKMTLVLEFKMVGPMRKFSRKICDFHLPKEFKVKKKKEGGYHGRNLRFR